MDDTKKFIKTIDPIVTSVQDKLAIRANNGIQKYGNTMVEADWSEENILQEIHDKYTQDQHIAKARFYSEAKQTVGRGILSGLIKE